MFKRVSRIAGLVVKYLAISVMTLTLSILIVILAGTVVPFRVGPDLSHQSLPPGSVITEREMKEIEETAKLRDAEDLRSMDSPLATLPDAKRAFLGISWLPWVILPFVVRVTPRWTYLVLIAPLLLLQSSELVIWNEVVSFSLALLIGSRIRKFFQEKV